MALELMCIMSRTHEKENRQQFSSLYENISHFQKHKVAVDKMRKLSFYITLNQHWVELTTKQFF